MFGDIPVVSFSRDKINELHWRILKRTFDLAFIGVLFILVLWWLWPLIYVLQKTLNPGPLYYKVKRWGIGRQEFICYKFRSMVSELSNTDPNGSHMQTTPEDPRVTKFGRFLRKTNIDEFPQFINVLKGEMSVVGPRPHDVAENLEIKDRIKSYMSRYLIKPGVTGWAQVNGLRGGTRDFGLLQKRIDYDLWYIKNWSFWLDIRIILKTIWLTVRGDPKAY